MTYQPGEHTMEDKHDSRNSGHGWVYPRPDEYREPCGGPYKCQLCTFDLLTKATKEAAEKTREAIEGGTTPKV